MASVMLLIYDMLVHAPELLQSQCWRSAGRIEKKRKKLMGNSIVIVGGRMRKGGEGCRGN